VTEAEWLGWDNFGPLLRHLRKIQYPMSERKLRMLALAYGRAALTQESDARCWRAIEVGERYTDGDATEAELIAARDEAMAARPNPIQVLHDKERFLAAVHAVEVATRVTEPRHEFAATSELYIVRQHLSYDCLYRSPLANVTRDLFRNPYRPSRTTNSASLKSAMAVDIAQTAYADRSFRTGYINQLRIPFLADALEDAGCTDAELLGHLRSPGPHVRGCWAVDLVLGKS
jgi:hypothetical protein